MFDRDAFATFVTFILIVAYLVGVRIISGAPQELSGYQLEIQSLNEGESFVVTALSPSVESAEISISAESTKMFLFTGTEEVLADEVDEDDFTKEVQTTLGEWQAVEAYEVDVVIRSTDALKVTVDRNLGYYALSFLLLLLVVALIWAVILMIIFS